MSSWNWAFFSKEIEVPIGIISFQYVYAWYPGPMRKKKLFFGILRLHLGAIIQTISILRLRHASIVVL